MPHGDETCKFLVNRFMH